MGSSLGLKQTDLHTNKASPLDALLWHQVQDEVKEGTKQGSAA